MARLAFSARHIVLATGSRPFRPEGVDFSHPRVFDSDTILDLSFKPQSITIYGAGVIGCEYASMFRNLGIKVNLVNTRAKLLEFLDDEIIDALSYHMRDSGVVLRHNEIICQDRGCMTTVWCSSWKAASKSRRTYCFGQMDVLATPKI